MKLGSTFVVVFTIAHCLQKQNTNGANILGVCLVPGASHLIINMSIMRVLAEHGHNVTMVSSYKPTIEHPNIRSLVIPLSTEMEEALTVQLSQITAKKQSMLTSVITLLDSQSPLKRVQYEAMKDSRFKALYENHDNKFDVVIIESFINDFQLAIAARLKIPIITTWGSDLSLLTDNLVGNPKDAIFMPANSFFERVINMLIGVMTTTLKYLSTNSIEKRYYDLLGDERDTLASFDEIKQNVSLLFINSHFSEGLIKPYVPAMVEIGGIQIKPKPDPLPNDIADFLKKSKTYGAILFSLGTNVRTKHVNADTAAKIYTVLAELKQNVIWKWDDLEHTPGNSSNILYKKWLPQDDILAHPSVKLFITHAGKGGIAEAQYHGVPLLALPMFGDQAKNAEKLVADGFGLKEEIHNFNEANFKATLESVLTDPKYAQNIKRFSQLYRDRPLTAQQTVVYWTEYVMRHRGAPHMQSPLKRLNFVQANSLDVILFLALIFYAISRTFQYIVALMFGKIFGKHNEKSAKSVKKVKKH